MKITKFAHSSLLVEAPERVVLFDPGEYSVPLLSRLELPRLDDIIITHQHGDHMDVDYIKALRAKFPEVRITAPADAKATLGQAGVANVATEASDGIRLFEAPHEAIRPFRMVDPPQEIGVHYLDMLTHPGDSHSFHETMPVLAMPVTAPWGSVVAAMRLALELKPRYVIPIHDWHWRDEARQGMYAAMAERFKADGIMFYSPVDGESFEVDL